MQTQYTQAKETMLSLFRALVDKKYKATEEKNVADIQKTQTAIEEVKDCINKTFDVYIDKNNQVQHLNNMNSIVKSCFVN